MASNNDDDVKIELSALDALNSYLKDLNDFKTTFAEFHKRGKEIKKLVEKEMKDLKTYSKKKRTRKPDSKPGGFRKPVKISDEMCEFIGIPKGKKLARTEVSKKLNEYIRDNNLQHEKDRRIIKPDEKLLALFSDEYKDECRLDFFTMQKYIKHHYIKDDDDDDEENEENEDEENIVEEEPK
jgi:chromatin remodeling complex protein RSC6